MSTVSTSTVTIPARTVQVLDRPYTAKEYLALPDINQWGEITRVVSLPLERMMDSIYDTVQEMLCASVVSELGETWEVGWYKALGTDLRADSIAEGGNLTLFEVCISPGVETAEDGSPFVDGTLDAPDNGTTRP